jgi:DNA-binding CsgD family transcriptional regulator
MLSHQRLSDLIGSIYDCAIDPERWPATIEKICRELHAKCGNIVMIDFQQRQIAYAKAWNFNPNSIGDNFDAVMQFWELTRDFMLARPMDQPFAGSRFDYGPLLAGESAVYQNRPPGYRQLAKMALRYFGRPFRPSFFRSAATDGERFGNIMDSLTDMARKNDCADSLFTVVLRDRSRIGLFCADRNFKIGFASDEDLEILGMLATHIRRAVTIGDLLSLKTLESEALVATLDKLAFGVMVVAADRSILHANEQSKSMLAAGSPVRSVQGRLHATGPANEELIEAVALVDDEVGIGKVGMAIALQTSSGEPAIAHVLPLVRGDVRSRLFPQAAAAIFITQPGEQSPADLSGFAEIYKLTPAETRVLQELLQGGATMLEVATALSVSETTAKTHLSHILAKTGVSRQAELITLVRNLVPPVNGSRA